MENLIKEIEKYQYKELTDKQWAKLEGEPKPGAALEIYWTQLGHEPDLGYLFNLPNQEPGDGDCIVHVPHPQNPDGMDEGWPQWVHLFNLLSNHRCRRIVCRGGL